MDAQFWHQRWEENKTHFHQSETNPLLKEYFNRLSVSKGGRVFLPLCGKTLDIPWLLSQGHRVAGAELSKIAIGQLFESLGVKPEIISLGKLDRYSVANLDIFVGDIFDLSTKMLGPVDAIYDRAALVALPPKMREQYSGHLMEITNKAPQLLISFEYDQSLMEGPPFSVNGDEVKRHYAASYQVSLLASKDVPGGIRGVCPAKENAWLLAHES
ncbi:MAG TPA: thiopurine S-methyltransferase [Pseudomonadales bacterium]|nr:thiopurine S-methyltransferase [Pseudomonadales bacterium]